MPPRHIVESHLIAGENGVTEWKDDGTLRVLASEPSTMTVGELLDRAAENATPPAAESLPDNTPLRLVKFGKTIATGRLVSLAAQRAFAVDDAISR